MNRLRRNISSLVGSEIARRLFGFASVAIIARVLSVDGFGQVMIGLSVLSYIVLGASAGINVLGTRGIAQGRGDAEEETGTLLAVRAVNALVLYLLVALVTIVAVTSASLRDVILITSASAFLHALLLDWYFQGKENMAPNAAARTLGAFIYLVTLLFLVHSPDDIRWAAAAAVTGDAVSAGYLIARFSRSGRSLRFRVSFASWRSVMVRAIPFGVGSVLGHVSVNLPIIIVAALLGTTDAGYFSAAHKLVFFLLMIDRILATLLLPASVRFQAESPEVLRGRLAEALRWTLLLGLPIAAGGTLLSREIVVLVYGDAFSASAPVLGILVWYFLMTLLLTVYTAGIVAQSKDMEYRNVMVVSAILTVLLVTLGLLAGGLSGAATGLVVSESATLLMMRRALQNSMPPIVVDRFGRMAIAAVVMTLVVTVLPDLHVLVRVAAGGVTYFLATVMLKAVSFGEYRTLAGRFV